MLASKIFQVCGT